MNLDAKNRIGNTLLMLHQMGLDPVEFSGYYTMYAYLAEHGIPNNCVSVGYLFTGAFGKKVIVEITADGFCAIREPMENEL